MLVVAQKKAPAKKQSSIASLLRSSAARAKGYSMPARRRHYKNLKPAQAKRASAAKANDYRLRACQAKAKQGKALAAKI
mgnify:CR=1 FL=1